MEDPGAKLFGGYVKLLRDVRGLTQDALAARCGVASDTIRRLEHGEFSPSLRTLRKVAGGFELSVSQLFQGFDLEAAPDEITELVALLHGWDRRTIAAVVALARAFLLGLDELD